MGACKRLPMRLGPSLWPWSRLLLSKSMRAANSFLWKACTRARALVHKADEIKMRGCLVLLRPYAMAIALEGLCGRVPPSLCTL